MICPLCSKPVSFYEPYEFKGNERVHADCFYKRDKTVEVIQDIKRERKRQDLQPCRICLMR